MPNNIPKVTRQEHVDVACHAVREAQCASPAVGPFFTDAYTFVDWFVHNYVRDTCPPVILEVKKLRHGRMAEYTPAGETMLPTIAIDPTKTTNGGDVPEWLAHEIWHHYEWSNGDATVQHMLENHHSEEFMNAMMDVGLAIERDTGGHRGYVGDLWQEILQDFAEESAVDMSQHVLPGPQGSKRKLHKWQCPTCDFSFRSRRTDLNVFCNHGGHNKRLDRGDLSVVTHMEMVE